MFKVGMRRPTPPPSVLALRNGCGGTLRVQCAGLSRSGFHWLLGPGARTPARGRTAAMLRGFATVAPTMLVSGMFQCNGPHQDRSIGKVLVEHLRQL